MYWDTHDVCDVILVPASEHAPIKIAKELKVGHEQGKNETHKKIRKSFCKSSFQLGMVLKNVQKQGRNEKTH